MRQEKNNENIGKDQAMPHYRTSLTYKTSCLNRQGYDMEFQIGEEGLRCLTTGEIFQPEDLYIVEHQRFEGISDPEDMAILYVVETKSGLKGTVVDAFGTYANRELMDFMKKVEDRSIANPDQSCGC